MSSSIKSKLLLMLFALPFAGVGLGFLFLSILPSLNEWQAMKSWPAVDAYLLAASLDINRGDDSDTYEALAHYRYDFNGTTYENDRVGIMGGQTISAASKRISANV